ncbi:autotransporter assembly complex family protein [Ramlibacter solisilvae]|uniref:autotransporter assembly complex protein TamA n=1 Tax=Ramlibacter tataouinensis TaxID=94132 RepID=UPI0007779870|nr:BamA/TamA family outer membrane protein [Ramlibacter tataouinensis]
MLCFRRAYAAATVAFALWLAAPALAQESQQEQLPEPTGPSFSIDVRAPKELRALLEQHMELRRYREVPDLDEVELARLIVLAERNVRELLATQGYFEPAVSIRREEGTGGKPVIVVEVEPHRPTQVGEVKIDFEGDIAQTTDRGAVAQREEILKGWRLPSGRRFSQEQWQDAKTQALRQLTQRRYPAGKVSYSLADVDAPSASAALGLRLDSGPVFRYGPTQVSGVSRYDPVIAPRLARLPVGATYDQEDITQAQLRLTGSGYFDSAFIVVDPESDPQAAPVQVSVREAPLNRVVLGLGVSTDSGARASLEHRYNEVPGIRWRAVTKLQLERKSPYAQTEWTAIPDERGWRWGTLVRVERVDDGTLVTDAQRLRVGRTWAGSHIERNVYVQYDRADVAVAEGVSEASIPDTGDGTSLSVNYVWTGRYFDRLPFPTRGYGVGFELGGGYTLTGSKSPFQRTVLRGLVLWPLTSGRIQFRAEAGAVFARDDAEVPSAQLFRTGGDNSVRGYGYRDIGVQNANGVISPGRFMTVGSLEWQRPIRRGGVETNLESAVFVDVGAVSDRPSNLRPEVGAGVGVRYKSPLGPLQVDLAYGFEPKQVRLHFNIGVTF